jgi:serine phosphatase RsbU (regulator of sigma subunit)
VFLVGVAICAYFCHLGPGLLAAGLSYLTVEYLFLPPIYGIEIGWDDMPLIATLALTATMVDRLQSWRFNAELSLSESNEKMLLARMIQQRLFPSAPPVLADFDIAGASHPADATGGDYFDFIPMPDATIGIVLADVSGHGFGSALLMAQTRAYLRALALSHSTVGTILTLTNRMLEEDTEAERFVTLFFAALDPRDRSFVYAGAGHEGFILGPAGETRVLQSTSIPWAWMETWQFPVGLQYGLEPGRFS